LLLPIPARLFFHEDEECMTATLQIDGLAYKYGPGHPADMRTCVVCGNLFASKRAEAKTCSGKCRVKLHRSKEQPFSGEGAVPAANVIIAANEIPGSPSDPTPSASVIDGCAGEAQIDFAREKLETAMHLARLCTAIERGDLDFTAFRDEAKILADPIRAGLLPQELASNELRKAAEKAGIAGPDEIQHAIDNGLSWAPPEPITNPDEIAAIIEDLAQLDAVGYGRAKKTAAEQLGITVADLNKAVTARKREIRAGKKAEGKKQHTEDADVKASWLPEKGFRLKDNGSLEFDAGDQDPDWAWLCSPIEIAAETSNEDGVEHGKLIRIYDRQNQRWHEWAMPVRLLAGDGNAYRAELFAMGLQMPLTSRARNAFGQLLMTVNPPRKIRCVERTGWHGNVFVLPNKVIGGDQDREVVFQSSRPIHAKFRSSGTLRDWQDSVAADAAGNSRLVIGISAAFAAPCLKLARQDGGGLHYCGDSSGGKTTALRVAGSVWGGGGVNGYVDNWCNTINGLEGRALAHSDALLCLQELGQADPDAAADAAYKISNGQGKGRMSRDAMLRDTPEWRVLFLSDGEITLDDKIREARGAKRRMPGQMVRVIDIEADAGKGHGAFDRVPHGMNGREFSDLLRENSAKYYGTAAAAFLEKLTADIDGVTAYLQEATNAFVRKFASHAGGQVERVAKRFGLIAAAGELAIEYSILPWPKGEPVAAAKRCFQEWLAKRGATGPIELEQGIDQIRHIIESSGSSRFEPWVRDEAKPIYDRLGYVRSEPEGQLFYVLPQGWKQICRGFNSERLAAELVKRGILRPGSGNKTSRPEWLPDMPRGKKRRVYVIDASALFGDEIDHLNTDDDGSDLAGGVPGVDGVTSELVH
jgi:uncharacterized protein (DUF927 family)